MRNGMIMAVALTALCAHGETVKTATQPWVRNYVATNTPSLTSATNYTDKALADFAATGTVWRSLSYGTATRWTDATGCVWACEIRFPTTVQIQDVGTYPYSGFVNGSHKWEITEHNYVSYVPYDAQWTYYNTESSTGSGAWLGISPIETGANSITLESPFGASPVTLLYSGYGPVTNLVGRVALTNDVTAEIRRQSLGGIWDSQLEVWWTPIMENGALRYCATTNINMEANQ